MSVPTARRTTPASWFVPTGRIPRRVWWVHYVLVIALVGVAATSIDATWFPDAYPRIERGDGFDLLWPFPDSGGPVTAITALVLLVPNVAAMVTRLHDRDHSAWWLLWNLLPGIGWLVLLVTLGFLQPTAPRPVRPAPALTAPAEGRTTSRHGSPRSLTNRGCAAGRPRTAAGPCACRSR